MTFTKLSTRVAFDTLQRLFMALRHFLNIIPKDVLD